MNEPPRLALTVLSWVVGAEDRRFVVSDLREEYALVLAEQGRRAATRWCWGQVVRSVIPSFSRRVGRVLRAGAPARGVGPIGSGFGHDLRLGIRSLSRTPSFTVAALFVLALGIGATTTIFAVVNAVLLRPLPFPVADRLVTLTEERLDEGARAGVAPPTFLDWRAENTVFDALAAVTAGSFVVGFDDRVIRVAGRRVTPGLFELLGVPPLAGRSFTPNEERPGTAPVAVLSSGAAARWFGGATSAIDRILDVNDVSHRVVGVLPPDYGYTPPVDLWLPLTFASEALSEGMRGARYLEVIGRLAPNVSVTEAHRRMADLAVLLGERHPNNRGWSVSVRSLHDQVVSEVRDDLWLLFAAVGLVFAIAWANVTNLVVARASRTVRDAAIRTALGATWFRLLRQSAVEYLVLTLSAGAVGTLLSWWLLRPLVALAPGGVLRSHPLPVDFRALGFAIVVSAVTGILLAVAAASVAARRQPEVVLRSGSTGIRGDRLRFRHALIVSEIALSVVLLVGAGVTLKAFARLTDIDPGFASAGVMTASVSLPANRYEAADSRANFFATVTERLIGGNAVEVAGVTTNLPLSGSSMTFGFWLDGAEEGDRSARAQYHAVSPDYFRAIGIPVSRGRGFRDSDGPRAPPVVMVNETLASRRWPGIDPIGRRITVVSQTGPVSREVVGVVGDVLHAGLLADTPESVYVPFAQDPWSFGTVVTRGSSAAGARAALAQVLQGVDARVPPDRVAPMHELIAGWLAPLRFQMIMLGAFATVALALATVGVYGVIAYIVGLRRGEIGVRVALGAESRDISRLFVGRGVTLAAVGVVLGGAAAAALLRTVAGTVEELPSTDPSTIAIVVTTVLLAAAAASYVPASRAGAVDPVTVLRAD